MEGCGDLSMKLVIIINGEVGPFMQLERQAATGGLFM
jgi:hypothetical protein